MKYLTLVLSGIISIVFAFQTYHLQYLDVLFIDVGRYRILDHKLSGYFFMYLSILIFYGVLGIVSKLIVDLAFRKRNVQALFKFVITILIILTFQFISAVGYTHYREANIIQKIENNDLENLVIRFVVSQSKINQHYYFYMNQENFDKKFKDEVLPYLEDPNVIHLEWGMLNELLRTIKERGVYKYPVFMGDHRVSSNAYLGFTVYNADGALFEIGGHIDRSEKVYAFNDKLFGIVHQYLDFGI